MTWCRRCWLRCLARLPVVVFASVTGLALFASACTSVTSSELRPAIEPSAADGNSATGSPDGEGTDGGGIGSGTGADDPGDDTGAVDTSGDGDGAEESTGADSPPSNAATPEAFDPTEFSSIVDLQAAGEAVDRAGNVVIVHGARLVDALRGGPTLFVDLGLCRAGVGPDRGSTPRFGAAPASDAPLVESPLSWSAIPLVGDGFVWPERGRCARGWAWLEGAASTVAEAGAEGLIVRYELEQAGGPATDRELYQWTIDLETLDDPVEIAEEFAPGETVTFHSGRLEGASVRVEGWAERFDAPDPGPGSRLVAVIVEVCSALGDLPGFGLAVDGYFVVEPLRIDLPRPTPSGEADSTGAASESVGGGAPTCRSGPVEFALAHGARPTSFYAAAGADPVGGVAIWSLVGGALVDAG